MSELRSAPAPRLAIASTATTLSNLCVGVQSHAHPNASVFTLDVAPITCSPRAPRGGNALLYVYALRTVYRTGVQPWYINYQNTYSFFAHTHVYTAIDDALRSSALAHTAQARHSRDQPDFAAGTTPINRERWKSIREEVGTSRPSAARARPRRAEASVRRRGSPRRRAASASQDPPHPKHHMSEPERPSREGARSAPTPVRSKKTYTLGVSSAGFPSPCCRG